MGEVDEASKQVHAVWDQMAPGWTRDTEKLWDDSRPIGVDLVDRLDPKPGETILELAAGTGDTGFMAARREPRCTVICSDFVAAMIDGACERGALHGLTNVDYRLIDAEAIELPDNSVHGVLCRWGYMLMPHPDRALAETRRVLRPEGRLAFSVWAGPERNPWATLVGQTLVGIGRPPSADAFGPGGVFSMSDPDKVRTIVEAAGFRDVDMSAVGMTWTFADFDAIWSFLTEVAGAVAVMIDALSEEERARFRVALTTSLEPFASDGGYALPGECLNVLAR